MSRELLNSPGPPAGAGGEAAGTGRESGDRVPGLDYEALLSCTHCGICFSVCPTFQLLGTEGDSPRGRLYLMRALAEGRTDLNPSVVHHLDTCLGCRACETVCPSAVEYGKLLEQTRDYIEHRYGRDPAARRARRTLLDTLTNPGRLHAALLASQVARRVPGAGAVADRVQRYLFGPEAPEIPVPAGVSLRIGRLPQRTPALGKQRGRVAFLSGCVMPVLFHRVNQATVRLLAANGLEVIVPGDQRCCGAFHVHNGELEAGRARAKRLIEVFERVNCEAIIVNSAGCGSTMKEYALLFPVGDPWRERAERFSARVRDVSEHLDGLGLRQPLGPVRARAVYHDACHLAHSQGIRDEPRRLLGQIPELELVDLPDADTCCGSAGIYNFLEPELARRFQALKVQNVLSTRPDIVVSGNPGCHAWIEAGLRAAGSSARVMHTAELLAEAYR